MLKTTDNFNNNSKCIIFLKKNIYVFAQSEGMKKSYRHNFQGLEKK